MVTESRRRAYGADKVERKLLDVEIMVLWAEAFESATHYQCSFAI